MNEETVGLKKSGPRRDLLGQKKCDITHHKGPLRVTTQMRLGRSGARKRRTGLFFLSPTLTVRAVRRLARKKSAAVEVRGGVSCKLGGNHKFNHMRCVPGGEPPHSESPPLPICK